MKEWAGESYKLKDTSCAAFFMKRLTESFVGYCDISVVYDNMSCHSNIEATLLEHQFAFATMNN